MMNISSSELPEFDQAAAALDLAGIEIWLPEIHGIVCGVHAAATPTTTDWLATILGGDSDRVGDLPKPVAEMLLSLYRQAQEGLAGGEFGLTLLLPDEEKHDIVERTEALAAWCRGFLLGLAEGGVTDLSSLSNEAREALEDMIDIAEVVAEDEMDEQQEQALAEVEEYVRVIVQFVFDERQREQNEG